MEVTLPPGEGALGTWRSQGGSPNSESGEANPRSRDEPMSKPTMEGAYVCQHFGFAVVGRAHGGKPRSEPDSGKPTVRDRRVAWENVAYGSRMRPTVKAVDSPPDH